MRSRIGAPNIHINRQRRIDRSVDELIGLCKGILADNKINQQEAEFLLKWIETNQDVIEAWPASQIYKRIAVALDDGFLDKDEELELFELLKSFTGHIPVQDEYANLSTTLPLDMPPPDITFEQRGFCLTGTFAFGKRAECQKIIADLGGIIKPDVSRKVDYLVVGVLGTLDWIHTSYGRKIERALKLKKKGHGIKIVFEDHWVNFLPL